MGADGDALGDRLERLEAEPGANFTLAAQDEGEGALGVHVDVLNVSQLLDHVGHEFVGFVHDHDRGLFVGLAEVDEQGLELAAALVE